MAMVISVEHVELVLDDTTISGALTKGQDMDNCVPFTSHHASTATGGYLDRLFCDVYFRDEGGTPTVRAERPDTSGALTVSVYVVEFDPNEVYVESGEINFTGTSDSSTISGSSVSGTVDTTRAAMVFNYQVTGTGSTAGYNYFVRGDLSSTEVSWQRYNSTGTIEGHYYVFEALNSQFKVQKFAATGGVATLSDVRDFVALNWRKSFIVGSYSASYSGDNPSEYACYGLPSFRNVISTSKTGTYNTSFIHFGIEFLTDKTHVEQGNKTLSTTTGVQTDTIDLRRSFDLDYSMVIMVHNQGISRQTGTAYTQNDGIFVGAEFNSASQITLKRNTIGVSGYTHWQVVDWAGVTHTKASPATPLENSLVKTVEAVEMTLDATSVDGKFYRYYELSKGQDISNCVVFETHEGTSTGGRLGALTATVWVEEPNLIGISRGYGVGTLHSTAYVVEFDPTHVKVQQGMTALGAVTDNTDTVSEVDLDKTAMMHYSEYLGSSAASYRMLVRGIFSDNSTVEFRRGYGNSSVIVSYFIFEALNDEFSVDTYTSSATGQLSYTPTDRVKDHSSFLISSYYMGYTGDDPQYTGVRSYISDEHSVLSNSNAYTSTYYHNYFIVELKYNPGRVYVQRGFHTHSTSLTTEDITPPLNFNLDSTVLLNPSRVITRSTGTVVSQQPSMFVRHKITSASGIEFFREHQSQTAYTTWQSIDWVGYNTGVYPDNQVSQGMVKSIEHVGGTISSPERGRFDFLTKGQNSNNCVPFVTSHVNALADRYHEAVPLYYIDQNIVRTAKTGTGGTMETSITVLEFNPNEVKVQSGSSVFAGTSTTVTIEEVDLDKTFVMAYTNSDSTSSTYYYSEIRYRLIDSTTLELTRAASSGNGRASYWIVEDIGGDNFTVETLEASGSTTSLLAYTSELGVDSGRAIILGSFYTTDSNDDSQYHHFRLLLRLTTGNVTLNRQSNAGTIYFNGYIVKFNDHRVKVVHGEHTYGTSDLSKTSNIPVVNPDRCIINCYFSQSMGRLPGSTITQSPAGYFKVTTNASGTEVTTERGITSTLAAYTTFQIAEFPINTHYFSGNVTENNIPATRQVFAYDRDTGVLERATTSSGTGGYYVAETTSSGSHFIIVLDNQEGDQYNLMGLDLMDPLPIN